MPSQMFADILIPMAKQRFRKWLPKRRSDAGHDFLRKKICFFPSNFFKSQNR